ncbi:MAG: oligosaccharide flippase family protein [bacterium]
MLKKIIIFLKKKIFKDFFWVYSGLILNSVSLFLLNAVLARALSEETMGIFSLSLLVLGAVTDMSDFGLNAGLLRFAAYYNGQKQPEKLKQVVRIVWYWRWRISIILTVGGLLLADPIADFIFKQPAVSNYLRLSFLGIGGVVILGFISTYLQSVQKFFIFSVTNTVKGFLRLLLIGLLVWFNIKNLSIIMSAYLLVPWVLTLVFFKLLPGNFHKNQLEEGERKKINNELAHFSFWITIWSLVTVVSSRIDQIMISNFLGLKEVSYYYIAMQPIAFYMFFSQTISSVINPKISSLRNKNEVKDFVKRILFWLIPVVLGLALFVYPSKFFINFFFGQKYANSIMVYVYLAYGFLFTFLTIPFSAVITVFHQTKFFAINSVILILLNIALDWLLIPRFGLYGAVITFAVGIIFAFVFNAVVSIYLFKYKEIKMI